MDIRHRTDFWHVCNVLSPKQGLRLYFYRDCLPGILLLFEDLNRQYTVDDENREKLKRLVETRQWSSSDDQIIDIWPLPNDYRFSAKWLADRIGKFLRSVDFLTAK